MPKNFKFTPYSQLLPLELLRKLTRNACLLYGLMWNRMAFRGVTAVIVPDDEIITRNRYRPGELQSSQAELIRYGLMSIEQLPKETCRTPRETTRYTFTATSQEADA